VRICIVAPSLDMIGGQSILAAALAERLAQVPGLEVGFVPVNPRLPGPLRLLQRVKYVRTAVTSVAYLGLLLGRLRRYDVIHVFSASYLSFVIAPLPAMLVSKLFGRTIVLNYHSGEADDHLTRWRHTVPKAMRLADAIVTPSGYLVDVFARHGIPARAIFNFVDAERIPFRVRRSPRPIFFSNRNLEPLYDVATTLRAFAIIQREVPSAKLILAGDGSQRVALERLAAELELRDVIFMGRVSPADMPALYDKADVFLNGSTIDNMPVSIVEAFAAGIPVVSTDAGGIPYIVDDGRTGLLAPIGDAAGLAAAALRLLREDGLAARLAEAARRECLERYTWPVVERQWETLYLDLALARRPRAA
jgi:glycosyltransferase involved in cell wall biosynthesis